MIKYPVYRPLITDTEKAYVLDCLNSSWISSKGKYVERFEREFAEYIGIDYAASVCNGTVALHAALLALGIGSGDEVIVPTLTYIASVNAVTYTGATPIFADSEPDTWQVDPKDVESRITAQTRAIMVVHLYGHPCSMKKLCNLARKYNLHLIEDCAESIGSEYQGKKVGTFGNIATFSFFGNKTITTGEGGMVITNSAELDGKVRKIKGQGLADHGEYWHDMVGYNYRMTNVAAAVGCAQLKQIHEIIARKVEIAECYRSSLVGIPVKFHAKCNDGKHSYWMCSILTERAGDREPLREYLKAAGIETRPLFNPVHTMPMYPGEKGDYPVSEELSARGINLPSYPELNNDDIEIIAGKIREFYEE